MSAPRAVSSVLVVALMVGHPPRAMAQATSLEPAARSPRFLRIPADASREPTVVNPAESAILSRRMSIDLHDVSRSAALREIGIAARIQFVYASDLLTTTDSVHVQGANVTVAAALADVLADAGVDVAITAGDNLTLVRKPAASIHTFRGTLRSTAGGAPVRGAMVVLVDTLRATRATARSDDEGHFVLRERGPGLFRLRVQRIGVRPYESFFFAMAGDTTAAIALDALPFSLPVVRSTAASACRDRSLGAVATWELWEDVRTALLETSLTYSERQSRFNLAQVKRVFDANPASVRTIAMREDTLTAAQPWTSFAPEILAERGYVVLAGDRLSFVAPDLDVLLSPSFENTHCFRPALVRDGGLIGLSFDPSRTLRNHTDIAGTFWLDPVSHELQRLTFRHTGLPFEVDDSIEGGVVTFARFDARNWFIPSWIIRAPIPVLNTTRVVPPAEQFRIFADQVEERDSRPFGWLLGGVEERRGVVLRVYRPRDAADTSAVWTGATGGIRVNVTTRAAGQAASPPVEGAEVRLVGTTSQRVSDASGAATFEGLTAGSYKVEVTSLLNAQFEEQPMAFDVEVAANTVATASVVMNSRRDLIRQHCGRDTLQDVIIGTVSHDRDPVAGAPLALYDVGKPQERLLGTFRASDSGRFVICVSRKYSSSLMEVRSRTPNGLEASSDVGFTARSTVQTIELSLAPPKVP